MNPAAKMPRGEQLLRISIALLVVGVLMYVLPKLGIGDGINQEVERSYELAAKHGTRADRCMNARILAAEYLKAGNEERFKRWAIVRGADCDSY